MKTLIALTLIAFTTQAHATIGGAKPRGYISSLVRSIEIQKHIYQVPMPVAPAAPVATPAPVAASAAVTP